VCGLVVKSSWLQIQMSRFDSRRYQIFWEVEGLEWGPLSLMITIEELLTAAVGIHHADHMASSIRKSCY
jgi:hypothetical protein